MVPIPDSATPIVRAGASGQAALELRGSILIYHRRNWVSSATSYLPAEYVLVTEEYRHDLRRLWTGLLGLVVTGTTTLPMVLLLWQIEPGQLLIALTTIVLLAATLFCLAIAIWSLTTFVTPRRATTLTVLGEPATMSVSFWHWPGTNEALDRIVEALKGTPRSFAENGPSQAMVNHTWRQQYPLRAALLQGVLISTVLYPVLFGFKTAHTLGIVPSFPAALFGLLLAPPLFYLGVALLRYAFLWREPVELRRALSAYQRGRLGPARKELESLLDARPEHEPARVLLVQVCAQAGAIDDAFRHLRALPPEHTALTQKLESSLWTLKRLYARMDDTTE